MRHQKDPLYQIFEQHLFNALVEEETTDEFLIRVVGEYLTRLRSSGTVVPQNLLASIEEDLKDEVLEMLRKKTYGHFNLSAFRLSHTGQSTSQTAAGTVATPKKTARRSGRAC